MGKNEIKKRTPLRQQIVYSFIKVLLVSLITSIAVIMVFYFIYYKTTGLDSSRVQGMEKIYSYLFESGNSLMEDEKLNTLDKLISEKHLAYYIKDSDNNVIYNPETSGSMHKSSFGKHLSEMLDNFTHKSTLDIPVFDKTTGKFRYILVLMYSGSLSLIELIIPFICLVVFTIVFSKEFSLRIRKPINELMNSVEKIKDRDLDFEINSTQEDEIGDLARAFEDMRSNLQSSLMREWKLEQERRDMVAAITHDLRTPLAIIHGHVEGLQDGFKHDNEKLDNYLDTIEQNSVRAKNLIEEMNKLVEIDSSGFSLNLCNTDLVGFLKAKINDMKYLAEKQNISVESEISDLRKENKSVALDSYRLAQVIDNIFCNAIRYTPQGGLIRLSSRIEEHSASFRICDTGRGFSDKDLPNLFKKFYKGDSSRSLEKGHSGLGLYISRSIIEKHGGNIQGFNLPDEGACIEFSIYY